MFSQPIVFVVGAGASHEFGLPVGSQLVASIALALNFNRDASGNLLGHQAFFDLLGSKYGQDAGQYHRQPPSLRPRSPSLILDEALHWFSARPDIVSLGKASIVREILAAECRSDIFNALNAANRREYLVAVFFVRGHWIANARAGRQSSIPKCDDN